MQIPAKVPGHSHLTASPASCVNNCEPLAALLLPAPRSCRTFRKVPSVLAFPSCPCARSLDLPGTTVLQQGPGPGPTTFRRFSCSWLTTRRSPDSSLAMLPSSSQERSHTPGFGPALGPRAVLTAGLRCSVSVFSLMALASTEGTQQDRRSGPPGAANWRHGAPGAGCLQGPRGRPACLAGRPARRHPLTQH